MASLSASPKEDDAVAVDRTTSSSSSAASHPFYITSSCQQEDEEEAVAANPSASSQRYSKEEDQEEEGEALTSASRYHHHPGRLLHSASSAELSPPSQFTPNPLQHPSSSQKHDGERKNDDVGQQHQQQEDIDEDLDDIMMKNYRSGGRFWLYLGGIHENSTPTVVVEPDSADYDDSIDPILLNMMNADLTRIVPFLFSTTSSSSSPSTTKSKMDERPRRQDREQDEAKGESAPQEEGEDEPIPFDSPVSLKPIADIGVFLRILSFIDYGVAGGGSKRNKKKKRSQQNSSGSGVSAPPPRIPNDNENEVAAEGENCRRSALHREPIIREGEDAVNRPSIETSAAPPPRRMVRFDNDNDDDEVDNDDDDNNHHQYNVNTMSEDQRQRQVSSCSAEESAVAMDDDDPSEALGRRNQEDHRPPEGANIVVQRSKQKKPKPKGTTTPYALAHRNTRPLWVLPRVCRSWRYICSRVLWSQYRAYFLPFQHQFTAATLRKQLIRKLYPEAFGTAGMRKLATSSSSSTATYPSLLAFRLPGSYPPSTATSRPPSGRATPSNAASRRRCEAHSPDEELEEKENSNKSSKRPSPPPPLPYRLCSEANVDFELWRLHQRFLFGYQPGPLVRLPPCNFLCGREGAEIASTSSVSSSSLPSSCCIQNAPPYLVWVLVTLCAALLCFAMPIAVVMAEDPRQGASSSSSQESSTNAPPPALSSTAAPTPMLVAFTPSTNNNSTTAAPLEGLNVISHTESPPEMPFLSEPEQRARFFSIRVVLAVSMIVLSLKELFLATFIRPVESRLFVCGFQGAIAAAICTFTSLTVVFAGEGWGATLRQATVGTIFSTIAGVFLLGALYYVLSYFAAIQRTCHLPTKTFWLATLTPIFMFYLNPVHIGLLLLPVDWFLLATTSPGILLPILTAMVLWCVLIFCVIRWKSTTTSGSSSPSQTCCCCCCCCFSSSSCFHGCHRQGNEGGGTGGYSSYVSSSYYCPEVLALYTPEGLAEVFQSSAASGS